MSRRAFLTLTLAVLSAAGICLGARAVALEAGDAPQLSEEHAIRLMRSALIQRYPVSWRNSPRHRVACPVGFHARRGGATQEREIRRRCSFSWSARGYSYRGRGMVWLGGVSHGERDWHFQARVVEEHQGKVDVDHIGGTVLP